MDGGVSLLGVAAECALRSYASLLKTGFVYVTEAHSLTRLPRIMHVPGLIDS